jgi:AAA15 family ATPase/GTPase
MWDNWPIKELPMLNKRKPRPHMVKQIKITAYKKLKNLTLNLEPGVNAISGTNGSCKTSVLHIISNSFQSVTAKNSNLTSPDALTAIKKLNSQVNTKIENLAKGDKEYNDPAPGCQGSLYEITYYNGMTLPFRRHTYQKANRYSIKPYYAQGRHESLPACPVIYLSLSRLFPWGEFQNDSEVKQANYKFPNSYAADLAKHYEDITGIAATQFSPQKMGFVKTHLDFSTTNQGIDANTISSGEDNILTLLTALLSLKYYYETLDRTAQQSPVCSVLLIDELDATLHPSFQYNILGKIQEFSTKYHIQVVFTTHSLVLLEQMFKKKLNVIYLMNQGSCVIEMPDPDLNKIEMLLKNLTKSQLVTDKIIPVFTEDDEARLFAKLIIKYLAKSSGFAKIGNDVHFVDANFGAEELTKLFKDPAIRQSSMASICILDGDHNFDLTNNVITLPGKNSPEWVAFDCANALADAPNHPFWVDPSVIQEGFSITHFNTHIKPDIEKQTANKDRRKAKALFNKHQLFFELVLKAWLQDEANAKEVATFAKNLENVYRKTAGYHCIYFPGTLDFSVPSEVLK